MGKIMSERSETRRCLIAIAFQLNFRLYQASPKETGWIEAE
jgi:hypothetical protein